MEILIVLAVILLGLAITRALGTRDGIKGRYAAKPALTRHELILHDKLEAALHRLDLDYIICPQIAMGAILKPSTKVPSDRYAAVRATYAQKICDTALVDAQGAVRLVIELDDASHSGKEASDARRDAMLAEAGIPTLRLERAHRLDIDDLGQKILKRIKGIG